MKLGAASPERLLVAVRSGEGEALGRARSGAEAPTELIPICLDETGTRFECALGAPAWVRQPTTEVY